MLFRIITLLLFLLLQVMCSSGANNWIRLGYWYAVTPYISIPDIDSTLFSHLACAYAEINSSTSQIYVSPAYNSYFSTFTPTVRKKNPSVITILSIWGADVESSNFSSMVSQPSRRNSFIQSSIRLTRLFGFQGIDLGGDPSSIVTNTMDLGTLFDEWRAAINTESKNSGQSRLILTVSGYYLPVIHSTSYPVDSMRRNVDWFNIVGFNYHLPQRENFTGAHAALYDPSNNISTDYGIKQWIAKGFPASKIVLFLPYYGYAWKLTNPKNNAIGAAASGPGAASGGYIAYSYIRTSVKSYGVISEYNATYVVNYFTQGSLWVCFDDVEAIKTKIAYSKEKGLLGYAVWQIPYDDDWILSKAAYEEHKKQRHKKLFLVVFLPLVVGLTLLIGASTVYLQRRMLRMKVMRILTRGRKSSSPNRHAFSFADIKTATNKFSSKNKLGEGGFGPVYKGKLPDGLEIAVKRLSETSHQGAEEFKNEVTLTAKLQHVNLVRLLGFCTEGKEKLLIYEYMPNKTLAFYLHDPVRRMLFDWSKWVQVIEGVTQGLIYLQEYSRWTIIHRDLKASNILLDSKMKPKISDFGLARIFHKDDEEANTSRIVGTYGYVPPEYIRNGIYSTKYDVYSFGVLLLQIISGKKNTCVCGPEEDLNLLEYAYELWKDGKGMEFVDPLLDDSLSSCKIMRCMQVALLCVQEKWQDRPSMLEVSSMLKNESEAVPTPKIPAFWTRKADDATVQWGPEICSVDVETISQLEPR
ncbi:cysteine-rich receptor-like protein kinase 19 isoform X7 [Diospyros lotus]|uniref:cysteine-rich receptor-like protein kinase 19 isoform X7 n=1 Tax=Diospyros lotus TaxID=55363 RepID=UPI002258CF86|nr:cysteine-rich receptor-like protein kinase 19 isoform X7 [Diospyros lotus]